MGYKKYFLVILAGLLGSVPVIAAETSAGSTASTATVARMTHPPVIDGVIEKGWIGYGDLHRGFRRHSGQCNGPAAGARLVWFNDQYLYIAVQSEVPPGSFKDTQTRRDSGQQDDGIEIWFDPNRDRRESGQGDQAFYQFTGNSSGAILDVRNDPKTGPDIGWNGHWQFASRVDKSAGVWTAEVRLPFADLGWTGSPIGRSIGVLIARNYKNPWNQVTWFPHQGAFVSWSAYPRLYLTEHGPSVQIESLGDHASLGQIDLRVRISNPSAASRVQVTANADSSDMPSKSQTLIPSISPRVARLRMASPSIPFTRTPSTSCPWWLLPRMENKPSFVGRLG